MRGRRDVARTLLKAVNRTVGFLLPPTLLAFRHPDVPGRIHVDDQMFGGEYIDEPDHYLRTGREGVSLIRWSLELAGLTFEDVNSCLILPSGYGRVIRHLVTEIAPSKITASDIEEQA